METEDIIVFINDVIVLTEIKKRHDDIMEEILKRMIENNLFVKPEKFMQKVRKVIFLEVVIRPDKVKIKKKKIQEVADWPVPKEVKDIQKFLGLVNYYR